MHFIITIYWLFNATSVYLKNTAKIIINNKTLDTEMFDFHIYEHSKACTGKSQFNPDITSYGKDTQKRKHVEIIIPAKKDFTFEIETYLGRSTRRCYIFATFDSEKGKTYIVTLENRGYCSFKLVEKIKDSNKLNPVKSLKPRRGIRKSYWGEENCYEGDWVTSKVNR